MFIFVTFIQSVYRMIIYKQGIVKKFMNRRFLAIVLYSSKGQLISKSRLARRRLTQKTNGRI